MKTTNNLVLLISAPTSSGKSLLASKLTQGPWNFKKLNTKRISAKILKEHEKKHFSEELSKASRLLHKDISNVKTLNQLCENHEAEELKKLYQDVQAKMRDYGELLFSDLYNGYIVEVDAILAAGYNCVVDHNIYLDPFPARRDAFITAFERYGDNFKILNIYTKLEKVLKNNINRNQKFVNFARQHDGFKEMDAQMSINEVELGYTSLHYRQPFHVLQNIFLHYDFKVTPDPDDVVLERLSEAKLQRVAALILEQQQNLLGFLIYYDHPLAHSGDFQRRLEIKKELEKVQDIIDRQAYYVVNQRCKFDFFSNFTEEMFDRVIEDQSTVIDILHEMKPWLLGDIHYQQNIAATISFKNRVTQLISEVIPFSTNIHVYMHFEELELSQVASSMLEEVCSQRVSILFKQLDDLTWQGYVLENKKERFILHSYNSSIYENKSGSIDRLILSKLYLELTKRGSSNSRLVKFCTHNISDTSIEEIIKQISKDVNMICTPNNIHGEMV